MSQGTRWIFNVNFFEQVTDYWQKNKFQTNRPLLLAGLFLLFLTGCATTNTNEPLGPLSRVFSASYDDVWRATQKALIKYPIQTNNIDTGVIETEPVKVQQIWKPPVSKMKIYPNLKYSLRASVQRGKVRNKDSTRVTLVKNVKLQTDFFSEESTLNSDGFEEKAILYRIERELQMDRLLKKAFSDGAQEQSYEEI